MANPPDNSDVSDRLLREAERLEEAGRWHEAIDLHLQAVQLVPDAPAIHAALANACRMARRRSDELEARRTVLSLARDDGERANALSQLADPLAFFGHIDEAVSCCREAASLAPGVAVYWMNLAAILIREHDAPGGLLALSKARALSGEGAAYLMWLGRAQRLLGRHGKAIDAFQRSVEIDPDALHVWRDLAQAYVDAQRYEDARTVFRDRLSEGLARHVILTRVACAEGAPETACALLEAGLRAMSDPEVFDEVRWHYCNRRSHEELIAWVREVSAHLPQCPWPHWILARLHSAADDLESAANEAAVAARLDARLAPAMREDAYLNAVRQRGGRSVLQ